MTGPQINPRTRDVNKAAAIIREAVSQAENSFGLSYVELFWILTDTLKGYASDALKAQREFEDDARRLMAKPLGDIITGESPK